MKISILDDYHDTIRHLPSFSKVADQEVTIYNDHVQDDDVLAERLADTEVLVLIRERTKIRTPLLERLPNLRLISQRSVFPHIDVDTCTDLGIVLSSSQHAGTPSYATAELTWGLVLSCMRRIPQQMASLKAGSWQAGVDRSLRYKTLGIYGFGRIGREVAKYGETFGMKVIFWCSEASQERAREAGFEVAKSKRDFFERSDVLSLHVRLYPSTRGMVTADDLAAMKEDAVLINTSRAGLIEPGALLNALKAGRPGFAGIDVYDEEPVRDPDYPIINLPNVVCTPHVGYVTQEEYDLEFTEIFDQILDYQRGEPSNVMNPDVLPKARGMT